MKRHSTGWIIKYACAFFAHWAVAIPGTAQSLSPTAGTYTGIYSGGNDFGTVTIAIDAQNNATCDFYSTPQATHYPSSGTVINVLPLTLSCTSADGTTWSAASDPTSAGLNVVSGFWASNIGSRHNSGTYTTYYASNSTATAGSLNLSAFSGFWYDSRYSGSGFNLLPSSVGLVVAYYGWDSHGNRLWLTSDIGPKTITLGTPITLNLSYNTGGVFNNPMNNRVAWGTLSVNFTTCNKATAILNGVDGEQDLNMVQLVGTIGAPGC
jgi:hypothetical protein